MDTSNVKRSEIESKIIDLGNGIIQNENEKKELLAQADKIKQRLIELNSSNIATQGAVKILENLLEDETKNDVGDELKRARKKRKKK